MGKVDGIVHLGKRERNLPVVIKEAKNWMDLKNPKSEEQDWKEGSDYYKRVTLLSM